MTANSELVIAQQNDLLTNAGWENATRQPLTGDASTRSYTRLHLGARTALLMYAPAAAESAACPAGATPQERQRLGYNAEARLAGPNLHAFIAIADTLRAAGLSAPQIYAADPAAGLALLEDFGDNLYSHVLQQGEDETSLYEAAIDVLITLHRADLPPPQSDDYTMLSYDQTAMAAEIDLLIDWYWHHQTGIAPSQDIKQAYRDAFTPALGKISAPSTIVLRDYHADNLLWLPERTDAARAGLIDFQDGLYGSTAYDLVSLLEDARRDVSPELAQKLLTYYCTQAKDLPGFDEQAFRQEYAILGAQRNAKILGIFARLIHRDGKTRYADFIPRVQQHFQHDLAHDALAPLQQFFADHRELLP